MPKNENYLKILEAEKMSEFFLKAKYKNVSKLQQTSVSGMTCPKIKKCQKLIPGNKNVRQFL